MPAPNITAVHGLNEQAGTITLWRMKGDADAASLAAVWQDEGLDADLLPSLPTDTVACRRAVYELRSPTMIVRPLKRRDAPDGWALVSETTDHTVRHKPELHVLPNKVGQLSFETPDGARVQPGGTIAHLAAIIQDAYTRHLNTLSSNDVSQWLVGLVRSLDALALKDTGGTYFIARPFVPQWKRMVRCIREGTPHEILLIPAMRDDEAVAAILSTLEAEASNEAQSMFDEVANGDLGERALGRRADRCLALQRKVAQYETLLGTALPGLTDRLTELAGALTGAAMIAGSDDNAHGVLTL